MNKIVLMILTLCTSLSSQAAWIDQAKDLKSDKDYLGLRIYLKKNFKKATAVPDDWNAIRKLLQSTPEVGLDLVWYWDMAAPAPSKPKIWDTYMEDLESADQSMLSKDFADAEKMYLKWIKYFKKNPQWEDFNPQGYQYLLHMWARSLYGKGDYAKSSEVYNLLSPGYFRIRQALFEKMWAGFRGGDLDVALGAIASQKSMYLSDFLDPEAYVVQIYAFKKLCRDKEIKGVLKELKLLQKALSNDKPFDTSFGDLEYRALKNLLDPQFLSSDFSYATKDRSVEQTKIKNQLGAADQKKRERLLKSIDKVLGYAEFAVSGLSKLDRVAWPDNRMEYLNQGYQLWPIQEGGEEWADEMSSYRYLGGSQCPG